MKKKKRLSSNTLGEIVVQMVTMPFWKFRRYCMYHASRMNRHTCLNGYTPFLCCHKNCPIKLHNTTGEGRGTPRTSQPLGSAKNGGK